MGLLITVLCIDALLFIGLIVGVVFEIKRSRRVKAVTAEGQIAEVEVGVSDSQTSKPVAAPVEKREEQTVFEEDLFTEVAPTVGTAEKTVSKHLDFAEKLLALDEQVKGYYDVLNNELCTYRKMHSRLSRQGASYRFGRALIARITVRGKTMSLHLALKVSDFNQAVFFQRDYSDKKAYAEIPFTVKVKSDRGLKNALRLIDSLAGKYHLEKKRSFAKIDSVKELEEFMNK